MDANCENGYFDNSVPSSPSSDPHFEFDEHPYVSFFTAVDPKAVKMSLKAAREKEDVRANASVDVDIQPDVFLTDVCDVRSVIHDTRVQPQQGADTRLPKFAAMHSEFMQWRSLSC